MLRKHKTTFGLLIAALSCLCAAVHAHIEDHYKSVHFHSGTPDFGTPPRRGVLRGEYYDRPEHGGMESYEEEFGVELTSEKDEERDSKRTRFRKTMLQMAAVAEQTGRWDRLRRIYERMAQEFPRDGSLRDRVEALRSVGTSKPTAARLDALRRYLHAMNLYSDAMNLNSSSKADDAEALFRSVYRDRTAGTLCDHALYQIASLSYERRWFRLAVAEYQRLLREFPHSRKREAALIMIARCAILPSTPEGPQLEVGRKALAQLLMEFPRTRFRRSAIGLRARIDYLTGQYGDAIHGYLTLGDLASVVIVRDRMSGAAQSRANVALLAAYLKRLTSVHDFETYEETAFAIGRLRKSLTADEAHRFAQRLLSDPDLPAPYLYYRLYHTENSSADLAHLAQLADTIVARRPATKLSPLVRVRLAEVYYQRRQYDRALLWANRGMTPSTLDRALYVRGATLHKRRQYRAALADFNALMARCPASPLRHGAREELAILDEAVGDLDGALAQYFALDYQTDIAFFLDVRMTIGEILHYRVRHAHALHNTLSLSGWRDAERFSIRLAQEDLLAYSLGIRYLREERWREAAQWLRRVPRAPYALFSKARREWESRPSPDPLTAIRDLSGLQRAIAAARSPNARAAALYRFASYYYTHGTLLLYNPALWGGDREMSFDEWWNASHATREDKAATHVYMYRHEVYARARSLCLEIAHRYPRSPVAPQALYRAACATYYLSSFNGWWDTERNHKTFGPTDASLMQELANRYPTHPLSNSARKYAMVWATGP